jgi:mono/diheme cytochrome c family protein
MNAVRFVLLAAVLAMTMAGAPSQFTSWPISQAPAELQQAISRADLLIAEMQGAVLRELSPAFQRATPETLSFCHLDATALKDRVAGHERVAMGRTSDRLRNPANAPRPWAAALVRVHAAAKPSAIEGFAVDLGDRLGVLRPIVEQPACATCHGPETKIAPAVLTAIRNRYPADRAVGFKDGDLRGWFWVELPKR